MARTIATADKDKDARLDYVFDWSAQMDADSDAVASATVSASPSGLGLGSPIVTASTVQCYASGGAEGTTYVIVNRVWTTGGRQDDKALALRILQQPSRTHSLVVEDGSGKTDANAYASVADADAYHAGHLYADTWTKASQQDREKALIMVTRLLDENVEWAGSKEDSENALQWPRIGAYDRGGWLVGSDEIPTDLKRATAEFARLMLVEDRTAFDQPDAAGFRRVRAGSLEFEVNHADRKQLIPSRIVAMIAPFGRIAIGSGVLRLVRA